MLDGNNIPFNDIALNMKELDFINTRLGGHKVTISGVEAFHSNNQNSLSIVEIGCGGGDNLRAIRRWADDKKLKLQLKGIDINSNTIAFAEKVKENEGIEFIYADYKDVKFDVHPDIIFSSLFCHHFTDDELVEMMKWKMHNSIMGFFINDLHRNFFAYHSIRLLVNVFSKSYLVKNDAPLSVQRGFIKSDWDRIFHDAGISKYSIEWKWAFRWLVKFNHSVEGLL